METPELTTSEYWESDSIDLRLNPRRTIAAEGLIPFLEREVGLRSSVVLATSGSSGGFKFVVLSKKALLASASAVVDHSGLNRGDVSLAGLSGFHVGGLGVYARAFLTGSRVVGSDPLPWRQDGSELIRVIEQEAVSLTSMTPTHLHDLVSNRVRAPQCLRLVFLGGGRMDPRLIDQARNLGWPVRVSYGMTEAGSQIATAGGEEVDWLPVLPGWETGIKEDGRLAIRGEALFSGYAFVDRGAWRWDSGKDREGWFLTGDRCDLRDGELRFLGRCDDLVKISGELVSLAEVTALASTTAHEMGTIAAVVALPDARRENELVAVWECGDRNADEFLDRLNSRLDRIGAVRRVVTVDHLPRTEIGKFDRAKLEAMANQAR